MALDKLLALSIEITSALEAAHGRELSTETSNPQTSLLPAWVMPKSWILDWRNFWIERAGLGV